MATIARDVLDRFDIHAGHIHVASGDMPITDVDWPLLAGPLDQSFDVYAHEHRHQLLLITAAERLTLGHEFYVVYDDLRLHTDLTDHPDTVAMGMILHCDPDFRLTTGRNSTPASPGDVYLLDANRNHGAKTKGLFAFCARDYRPWKLPSVEEFRQASLAQFRTLLKVTRVHHVDAENANGEKR